MTDKAPVQQFVGATVLVTGGGNGIGRRMALEAARKGARVVIWDFSTERAERVRDEIRALGRPSESFTVNVADRAAVAAAADATGPVDILINSAGVVTGHTLLEGSDEGIERTMNVNVLALYWVTRAFLGGMVERGRGTVVTVASAAGLVGVSRQTDYSASKFAAFGFNESLRAEMRAEKTGVRTLVVCPYYVDTGMFEGVQTRFPLLLPILREQEVAAKVIASIEKGKEQLILPRFVSLIAPTRALPVAAFDRVMDFLGVNHTMDHFTGRAPDGDSRSAAKG
jgi:all-trans-retinol dehydrogenase (NAD+)